MCPFCAGNEHLTPPETLRLGDGPTGWDVRVVPNLYPALERQEVVMHGPADVESLGDLPDATIALVAEAWQRRARDADGNCFAFLNEGGAAGASQPQLPLAARLASRSAVGRGAAAGRGRARTGRPSARLPGSKPRAVRAGDRPAERAESGLASELLAPALRLLAEAIRRLHELAGADLPLNAWLHDGTHWRLELLPRTTRFAGSSSGRTST